MQQVHTTATIVPFADAKAAKCSKAHSVQSRRSSDTQTHIVDLQEHREAIARNCAVTAYAAEMLAIHIRSLSHCIERDAPRSKIEAAIADIDGLTAALHAQLSKIKTSLCRPNAQ